MIDEKRLFRLLSNIIILLTKKQSAKQKHSGIGYGGL
jgi:hypothetical protein